MFGYVVLSMGIIFAGYSIYAQSVLSQLVQFVRSCPEIVSKTGKISDFYFVTDLARCRYGLVHYLYRNVQAPAVLEGQFPEYEHLRKVSNIAYILHLLFGITVLAGMVFSFIVR